MQVYIALNRDVLELFETRQDMDFWVNFMGDKEKKKTFTGKSPIPFEKLIFDFYHEFKRRLAPYTSQQERELKVKNRYLGIGHVESDPKSGYASLLVPRDLDQKLLAFSQDFFDDCEPIEVRDYPTLPEKLPLPDYSKEEYPIVPIQPSPEQIPEKELIH